MPGQQTRVPKHERGHCGTGRSRHLHSNTLCERRNETHPEHHFHSPDHPRLRSGPRARNGPATGTCAGCCDGRATPSTLTPSPRSCANTPGRSLALSMRGSLGRLQHHGCTHSHRRSSAVAGNRRAAARGGVRRRRTRICGVVAPPVDAIPGHVLADPVAAGPGAYVLARGRRGVRRRDLPYPPVRPPGGLRRLGGSPIPCACGRRT